MEIGMTVHPDIAIENPSGSELLAIPLGTTKAHGKPSVALSKYLKPLARNFWSGYKECATAKVVSSGLGKLSIGIDQVILKLPPFVQDGASELITLELLRCV